MRYKVPQAGGKMVSVETAISGWQSVNGISVPAAIVRYEDGKAVFTLNIASSAAGPAKSDNQFLLP
ncbi:MAG: hypothetical protein ABJF23_29415 [Bryobacteraceae bacterium]